MPLTHRDRVILDLEVEWWRDQGGKDGQIRTEFDMSSTWHS